MRAASPAALLEKISRVIDSAWDDESTDQAARAMCFIARLSGAINSDDVETSRRLFDLLSSQRAQSRATSTTVTEG